MNHYVYLLTDDAESNYIGVRSCKCLIQDDTKYWGSSKYNPPNMKETHNKIILKRFDTRLEANKYEQEMHDLFDVSNNDQFWNKRCGLTWKFSMVGRSHSDATKLKMSINRRNNPNRMGSNSGAYNHSIYRFYHPEYGLHNCTQYQLVSMFKLIPSGVSQLCSTKYKVSEGWILLRADESIKSAMDRVYVTYKFYHPDHGVIISTGRDHISKFNLSQGNFNNLLHGHANSCYGWIILLEDEDVSDAITRLGAKDYLIKHNFKHEVHGSISCTVIDLINKFKIRSSSIYLVSTGKAVHANGWCLDTTQFVDVGEGVCSLLNVNGDAFTGTIPELIIKYPTLDPSAIYKLKSGKQKTSKGWTLVS